MGIILGLAAGIGWGIADFLARQATQHIGTYRTLFWMEMIGVIGLSLYLLGTRQLYHLLTGTSWQPWAWAILATAVGIVSTLALYRAFEVGTLTLVSPIASSYAAVTVVLSFLSGEALTLMRYIGIIVVLLGVIVAVTPQRNIAGAAKTTFAALWRSGALRGVGWAITASLGFGTAFWLLGFHVTPVLGGIIPVWLARIMTPFMLIAFAPLLRQTLHLPPRGHIWWYIVGVGVFDTLAFASYTFGLTQGQISIVTIFSSLYSVVTIVLAGIFLREHLQKSQWAGVGAILVGIALVNV